MSNLHERPQSQPLGGPYEKYNLLQKIILKEKDEKIIYISHLMGQGLACGDLTISFGSNNEYLDYSLLSYNNILFLYICLLAINDVCKNGGLNLKCFRICSVG